MAQEDNEIIADVSININDKDINNFSSLEKYVENVKTNFEALTRSSDDVKKRLNDISDIQEQAEKAAETIMKMNTAIKNTSNDGVINLQSVPENFSGTFDWDAASDKEREVLIRTERLINGPNKKQYAQDTTGTKTPADWTERIGQMEAMSAMADAMGKAFEGGSNGDFGNMLMVGSQFLTGMSGGKAAKIFSNPLMRGFGVAGAAVGLGAAGLKAYQKGGETVQGFRNTGNLVGGGFMKGVGYDMAIRSMAMNPFINTEQSRQIVMSALTNGYTGKEFDTVTDFMADNLTKMNMSVADSTALLNKNVREGGQSIKNLSEDLGTLKELTSGGILSLEDRQKLYSEAAGNLIDANVSGEQASNIAKQAGAVFDENEIIAGQFSEISANASDQLMMQAGRLQGITNKTPNQIRQMLGDSGRYNEAIWGVIRKRAEQFRGEYEKNPNQAAERFMHSMRAMGISLNMNEAEEWLKQALDPNNANVIGNVQEEINNVEFGVEDNGRMGDFGDMINETFSVAGTAIADFGSIFDFGASDNEHGWENITKAFKDTGDAYNRAKNAEIKWASGKRIKAFDDLIDQYGFNNMKFYDNDGKEVEMYYTIPGQRDKNMERLASGDLKVSVNGGEAMSLQDHKLKSETDNLKGSGDSKTEVIVSPTPELRRLLGFNQRSSNDEKADAGYGYNTRNNPAPGDR